MDMSKHIVDNDGNLVGLENAERDAEDISEMIKSLMAPIPEFALSLHAENGRKFVFVSARPEHRHQEGSQDEDFQ